jgi:hypothetical protein
MDQWVQNSERQTFTVLDCLTNAGGFASVVLYGMSFAF